MASQQPPSPSGPAWIWIDPVKWPAHQRCQLTLESQAPPGQSFGVAEFAREYRFDQPLKAVHIQVSGDTKFRLYADDNYVGHGPVCVGGDFGPAIKPTRYFINHYTYLSQQSTLRFHAQVQLSPAVLMDLSCGEGGFWLSAQAELQDGSCQQLHTDGQWLGRLNPCYLSATEVDFTLPQAPWLPAVIKADIWAAQLAPIPMLFERMIAPVGGFQSIRVPAHAEARLEVAFDKIHAGFVSLRIAAQGRLRVELEISEIAQPPLYHETITTDGPLYYRGLRMFGIGHYRLRIVNDSQHDALVSDIGLIACHYPVAEEGRFECSDEDLNRIYLVSKWTLRICRQTIHLDSPVHQELLACTGDYFIQSLMNYFTFGDPRLTRLDIIRTADRMRAMDGRMFHTTYSLIWVQMLYDYYLFTGDAAILTEVEDALHTLMDRFSGYMGDNGVIDTPPDYMFVDWTVIDGYSMHHPPKALGQTSLNAYYYNALLSAAKISQLTGAPDRAQRYLERAQAFKAAFNRLFWDEGKGLYMDGLNDPTPSHRWLPANSDKRYHTTYSNTLAALYGLCDDQRGQQLMARVLSDELPPVQPYFMHFVLEAVHRLGMFPRHGLQQLRRWKIMVDECDKGLKEGWFPPQEDYYFDYSHAWTGTPAYQLPARLLGLEMIRPGFKQIRLKPQLFGLTYADIEIPTPYGTLRCRMRLGQAPQVEVPSGIVCEVLA